MTTTPNESAQSASTPIRVLCVDDHAFVVEGLRARLGDEADIEIVGSLPRADDLPAHVETFKPDVVLLDVDMPGRDVFEAIDDLSRAAPNTRCVLLSGYIRDTYLDAAVKNGAWGYLSKQDEPAAIADAVRRVFAGQVVFSHDVNERCATPAAAERNADRPTTASRLALLTPRELQILRMIGRGMARNDIAASIHRSPKTVDAHRASIMDKLGLHDRVDLARFAIREGLVEA
ncbi:MAG: response regulator transcription factor [Planctomycetota bacterium]